MKTKQSKTTSPGMEEEVAPGGGGYRKGPWTEQEDMKLVWFVRLFGERRWDFLAKVSGLNRTGKSCRLRWVNYLHPDLKRGLMTPDEERLVVELHAKWGNRWSRIAKDMPGRTDNEIKNYWRTHTRKQDKTARAFSASASTTTSTSMSPTASSSSSSNKTARATAGAGSSTSTTSTTTSISTSSSSSSSNDDDDHARHGGEATAASQEPLTCTGIGMDSLLWNDLDSYAWSGPGAAALVAPSSPVWDYCCSDSLWGIGDDEVEYKKMLGAS